MEKTYFKYEVNVVIACLAYVTDDNMVHRHVKSSYIEQQLHATTSQQHATAKSACDVQHDCDAKIAVL